MKLTAAQAGITVGSQWVDDDETVFVVIVDGDAVWWSNLAFKVSGCAGDFLRNFRPIDPEAHIRAIRAEAIRECVEWVFEHGDCKHPATEMRKAVLP